MAEIVNLRQARKGKARVRKEVTAAQNRAIHGRSGVQKRAERDAQAKAAAFVEAHRRKPAGDGSD